MRESTKATMKKIKNINHGLIISLQLLAMALLPVIMIIVLISNILLSKFNQISVAMTILFTSFTLMPLTTNGAFFHHSLKKHSKHQIFQAESSNINDLKSLQEEKRRSNLLRSLFDTNNLTPLNFYGVAKLDNNNTALALSNGEKIILASIPVRMLPLLESCLKSSGRISKTKLLMLNTLLTNVDGGLFDNLPYSSWSVDNATDASGNAIDEKFSFGKRNAYNRFLGKDWPGGSVSIGNLAQRTLNQLDNNDPQEKIDNKVLFERIYRVKMMESRAKLAELEYALAVAKSNNEETLGSSTEEIFSEIETIREQIQALERDHERESPSALRRICENLIEINMKNPAPYRGAYGYAPYIDTQNDCEKERYRNPLDLLNEILSDQFNAKVIGCLLENSFLLSPDVIELGGAIVLQKNFKKQTVVIEGNEYEVEDDADAVLNGYDINSGDVIIVECFAYEAIAMALSVGQHILLEDKIFQSLQMSSISKSVLSSSNLPYISLDQSEDHNVEIMQVSENNLKNPTIKKKTNAKTSSAIVPNFLQENFSTESINIRTLDEYDTLSIYQKAQILNSLSSFNGRLPRPRVLNEEKEGELSVLDKLLLPYVDEYVRREFNIRLAEENGDKQLAKTLRENKSKRHLLLDAINNKNEFFGMSAEEQERELEILSNMRADITQDEGTYNRYLDSDEWYERQRMKNVERARKRFGNLF